MRFPGDNRTELSPEPRWDPSDYAAHSPIQERWGRELIARLCLRGDEQVLDVGCGDGRLTALLAAAVPRGCVLGVDASPEMIAHARTAFPEPVYPRLRFAVCAAEAIGGLGVFDVVYSNATLHWVRDHERFVQAAASCLRSGGRLGVFANAPGNAREVFAALLRVIRQRPWRMWFRPIPRVWTFHEPACYEVWLRKAGFRIERVRAVERLERFVDPTGLAGWLRTTWLPYTWRVPDQDRPAFLEAIVAEYLRSHPREPDGTVPVQMRRLELQAVRL